MKKTILIIPLSLLLGACVTPGVDLDEICPAHSGPKSITLYYDEDGISIKAKTKVKPKSVFIIKLKPSKEFRDKDVTTKGESVEPDDGSAPDKNWLDKTDKWTNSKSLVYCVPNIPEDKKYTYKYSVEIEDLGMIDPRVHVEN